MVEILEAKLAKSGDNTPRMDKILKLFEWKKHNTNMIEYISTKRTLFADVNDNPPKEQVLPEEYLVASVIMGLPEDIRKICLSWSTKS